MKFKKSCIFLLALLTLGGAFTPVTSANVKHIHLTKAVSIHKQAKHQQNKKLIDRVKKNSKNRHHRTNWFRDGLNKQNFKAREWVTYHESGHRWNIVSYGHICIGYFQLDPHYLGYKHGRVNLNHKHQVKIADAYAKSRYGSWVNAKHFWQAHHWY